MLGVVIVGMESTLSPRLRPQNPLGAEDQLWTLPSTPPAQSGAVFEEYVVTRIGTALAALRKMTQNCADGGMILGS